MLPHSVSALFLWSITLLPKQLIASPPGKQTSKPLYFMRKQKEENVTLKNGTGDIQLDYAELRKAVLVLRAINHKLRQRIIDLLEENDEMTVTDIYIKLRLEQSVASQHLAILRRAGVVTTNRSGKFIYYSLDNERLSQIARLVEELAS